MAYWSDEYGKLEPVFDDPQPDPRLSRVPQAVRKAGGGEGSMNFFNTLVNGMRYNQGYGGGQSLGPGAPMPPRQGQGGMPGVIGPATYKYFQDRNASSNRINEIIAELTLRGQYDMDKLRAAHGYDLEKLRMERDWRKEDAAARQKQLEMIMSRGGSPGGAGATSGGARAQGPTPSPSASPGVPTGPTPGFTQAPQGGALDSARPDGMAPPLAGDAPPVSSAPAPPQGTPGMSPSDFGVRTQKDSGTFLDDPTYRALESQYERLAAASSLYPEMKVYADAIKQRMTARQKAWEIEADQRKAQGAGEKALDKARGERAAAAEKAFSTYSGVQTLIGNLRSLPDRMKQIYGPKPDGTPAPTGTFGQQYSFDGTIGPETNLAPFKGWPNIGAVFPWLQQPGNAFGETRAAITGTSNAINLQLKALVQEAGDGTWSEGDQETVNKLLGELLTADDEGEYYRRLDVFNQNLDAILVAKGVDPRILRGTQAPQPTAVKPSEQTQEVGVVEQRKLMSNLEKVEAAIKANPQDRDRIIEAFRKRNKGLTPDEARKRFMEDAAPQLQPSMGPGGRDPSSLTAPIDPTDPAVRGR